MHDLAPAFDFNLYRPAVLAVCFFASAALNAAVAAIASSGRSGAADLAARRAFATNVLFVVLVQVAVGARFAAGSEAQARAVLRLGLAVLAGCGPATLDFVTRLAGTRTLLWRALAWAGAVVLALVSALTGQVVTSVSAGGERFHGGPMLPVLMLLLVVEVGGALVIAWRSARATDSPLVRRQLHAVIAAYGVGFLGVGDALRLMGAPVPPLSFLFLTASAAIIAHALRAFHLLATPDLGWRALAWLFSSALAVVPVLLILVATDGWSGWSRPVAAALALEAIYLMVRFYARKVRPAIDDLFLRRRRDLERDLDDLNETLLVVRAVPEIAGEVARFLARALYVKPALFAVRDDAGSWRAIPPGAEVPRGDDPFIAELAGRRELWIRDPLAGAGPSTLTGAAAAFFASTGAHAVIPLAEPGPGALLGVLAVTPRPDRSPLVPVELELLRRLGPVVASSLSSARLYDRRQALRLELEDRVAARALELAHAREALERAQDDIVRREKLATVGLVIGGVAEELEQAVLDAALAVPRFEADLAACEAAAEQSLAARPDLRTARLDHVRLDVYPLIAAVAEGARRAKVIARDLSHIARPGPGLAGQVDLAHEIAAAITLLEPDLSKRVTITRELPSDLPPIGGDPGAIGQVLLNLLSNAAQAIEGAGTILVRARVIDGGERIEVAVRDSGHGIRPEHLPRLFEPFFTTKVAGTRSGSGLGLFVSHGIVQRHGGELQVESEIGRGSEFRVLLPVIQRSQ